MRLTAVTQPSAKTEGCESGGADEVLQRRSTQRRSLKLSAVASSPSARETQFLIRDISPGGLLIEAEALTLAIDDEVEVQLPDLGVASARVVWASGPFFGCEFSDPISVGAVSAALLKATPQSMKEDPAFVEDSASVFAGGRTRIEPKINLSAAFFLSLALWALVGLAVYLLTR